MKFNVIGRGSVIVAMVCLSTWAWPNEVATDDATSVIEPIVDTSVVALQADETSPWGVAVSVTTLAGARGGFDVVKNDMQLSGTVANNSALNVLSGSNLITNGSFANSSGFSTVVQNSGSNVLIQSATIINLQYE
ncbi:hypothetical protein [Rhodoferax sp. PAMC 29310]|uniref:hypothetical protein n=1 Tax=Rhodoferax sp. PAMC 29310 TaxID=2822760 RepID=UPI001B332FEE|nr:hypothetical protein [Rhodoferax sp. PAMC 29310]